MPNYKVTKESTQRVFTIAQVQALRTLYGYAVQLVKHGGDLLHPNNPQGVRLVEGGDFDNLVSAIEKVKSTMKKD